MGGVGRISVAKGCDEEGVVEEALSSSSMGSGDEMLGFLALRISASKALPSEDGGVVVADELSPFACPVLLFEEPAASLDRDDRVGGSPCCAVDAVARGEEGGGGTLERVGVLFRSVLGDDLSLATAAARAAFRTSPAGDERRS